MYMPLIHKTTRTKETHKYVCHVMKEEVFANTVASYCHPLNGA